MKVKIDKKACARCNACEFTTQGLISCPGNSVAILKKGVDLSDPKVQKKIRLAAQTCPYQAIKIEK